MDAIVIKSLGMLIDELITTNIKCFMQQEVVTHSDDTVEIATAAVLAQQLNARRNQLIRAIDKLLGDSDVSPTAKTYDGGDNESI